jgi:hypothetical protein
MSTVGRTAGEEAADGLLASVGYGRFFDPMVERRVAAWQETLAEAYQRVIDGQNDGGPQYDEAWQILANFDSWLGHGLVDQQFPGFDDDYTDEEY